MFHARTDRDIQTIRAALQRVGKLSDNIVGIGPFGIGLDGILAWIPVVGEVYSFAAGGLIVMQGMRARAPMHTLIQAFLLVTARTAIGAPASALLGPFYPLSGAVVDLFRGHKMAADMLVKSIDETLYVEGRKSDAAGDPAYAAAMAGARRDHKRVVFLG